MSAPKTNVEKQAKRHRGPLSGFIAVALFALTLFVGLAIWAFTAGDEPVEPEEQVNDFTGEVEENPAAGD